MTLDCAKPCEATRGFTAKSTKGLEYSYFVITSVITVITVMSSF